jgi:hypothetical protein
VKGRWHRTMGRGSKGGGSDFGYIFKSRTWSFEPKKARRQLVRLERPGYLVPDSQFALIHNFYRIFHQIRWARAIFRRIIKSDITQRTDRMMDELIWGGLGMITYDILGDCRNWSKPFRSDLDRSKWCLNLVYLYKKLDGGWGHGV